jgi:hypothetical protein
MENLPHRKPSTKTGNAASRQQGGNATGAPATTITSPAPAPFQQLTTSIETALKRPPHPKA